MAKSDTFSQQCSKVGSFSQAGNFTLYVVLNDRNGNAGTNKSKVDYNVYCQSNGSGSINARHYKYFSINGEEKINTTETVNVSSPYAYIPIASGTIEVTHNSDGSKSIPFSAEIQGASFGVSASVSGTFQLEKIPRYFSSTPSITLSNRTLTSITFKWSTSETCDKINYTLNGTSKGEIWTGNSTNGTLTISNLKPNTQYSLYISCRRKDSQLSSNSNTLSIKTYDIARITEAPNINIGSSHTIKWTNPGGATLSLKLCKTDGTQVINYGTVTGTSKKVTPTASTIYALTPNSNSIILRYILTTTQGSYTATNYKDCRFSVTNSNPTFSNFTYQDTNSTTVALTGNNQTIIKGYSNVKGIISTANKATAKNSATMSKYRLSIGDKTAEVAYSSTAQKEVTINNVQSNSFTMYAIDSRGNSTGKTITAATYINYSSIKITSINLVRTNSITSETTLKFSGNIWNGNFGSVTNSIVSCYYRYKLSTASSWTTGTTTITPTKNGGTFSFSGIIKGDLGAYGFDIDNSYNIQVFISDKLSNNNSNPATFILGPGSPGIAIYKNNVAIGQRYDKSEGSKLQVNGKTKFYDTPTMAKSSGETCYYAQRTDSNVEVGFGVGAGGINHGIFSRKLNKWLIHGDASNVYLNGYNMNRFLRGEANISDFNSFNTQNSVGSYNSDTTNKPNGLADWGTLINLCGSGLAYEQQLAIGNFNIGGYRVAIRSYINKKATSWEYLELKSTVLYDNTSGTAGTITLSESKDNFTYLKIFSDAGTKMIKASDNETWISEVRYTDTIYQYYTQLKLSGTTISRGISGSYYSGKNHTENRLIYRVLGYR